MKKKAIFVILLYCLIIGVSGCNFAKTDSIDNSTYDDIMYVASIPQAFICLNNTYVQIESSEPIILNCMVGYLINENELEYWKSIDKNNGLVYALDIGNAIFRKTDINDNKLKNRFELYAYDETFLCLAIKDCANNFIFYHKQCGINNSKLN